MRESGDKEHDDYESTRTSLSPLLVSWKGPVAARAILMDSQAFPPYLRLGLPRASLFGWLAARLAGWLAGAVSLRTNTSQV